MPYFDVDGSRHFEIGDRIEYRNSTDAGEVIAVMYLDGGKRAYEVEWDDGTGERGPWHAYELEPEQRR